MRVAIVGTGGVARRHLGILRQLAEVEVVGHVSTDSTRAEAQAAEWGGQACTRMEELLEKVRPEAVWICVTPDRHGALELALIEQGVPFFVEKPRAADLSTAERVANRLASTRLVVAVGYKFRALDTLARARALLEERPTRMVLALWHDSLPPPQWWRQARRSGGQVVEQATHLLDLARVLVGEAEVVAGLGRRWPRADAPGSDVPDVSTALLRFQTRQGLVPGLLSTTSLLAGHGPIELQLVTEGRLLRLSERSLSIETGKAREEVVSTVDPFLMEDTAFLEAALSDDPGRVLCSYVDALESHRLAWRVREALEASS